MTCTPTTKTLTLLRGLPGSGKSFLGSLLRDAGAVVISTDDYFLAGDRYLFDAKELGQVHAWNQRRCAKLMQQGVERVVVDNTNTQLWEMREYVRLALAHNYAIEFDGPTTAWAWDVDECARRNQHGCPRDAIQRMADRFEELPGAPISAILESVSPFGK